MSWGHREAGETGELELGHLHGYSGSTQERRVFISDKDKLRFTLSTTIFLLCHMGYTHAHYGQLRYENNCEPTPFGMHRVQEMSALRSNTAFLCKSFH